MHLAKVITIINEGNKIQLQPFNNVDTQKKIEDHLYSTKKKIVFKNNVTNLQ